MKNKRFKHLKRETLVCGKLNNFYRSMLWRIKNKFVFQKIKIHNKLLSLKISIIHLSNKFRAKDN